MRFIISSLSFARKVCAKLYSSLGLNKNPWMKRRIEKRYSRLITDAGFRRKMIKKSIMSFNGRVGPKQPGVTRIFSLWEENGRMIWLSYAASRDPECEVFHITRGDIFNGVFNQLLRQYVDLRSLGQVGEVNLDIYYSTEYSNQRKRFQDYCKDVMSFIRDYYQVDVWLLPKLNDDWIVDLIMAIKGLGKPLVVNDRESQISPKRMQVYPAILKKYIKDCEADLLCLNNEYHKEFFIRSGYDPAKLLLTGKPDTDYWHRKDLWKTRQQIDPRLSLDRFIIQFFSFGPQAYLNFYFGKETRTWYELAADYHDVLLEILKKYHDRVQLIYKTSTKEARDKYSQVNLFHQQAKKIDDQCIVAIGGTVNSVELVRNVDVVLGFQTSGLTEAMFTDRPIVFGAWGEFYDDIKDWLLPYHKTEALLYAKSKDEMYDYLVSLIEGETKYQPTEAVLAARKAFYVRYFYNPDGTASQRILDAAKQLAKEWDGSARP